MKKILFLVLAMAVAFSCQKKELETPNADVEVVFGIQKVDPNDGLKADDPPLCPTDPTTGELLEPAYAKIWITGPLGQQIYEPTVFELNGMLYTQAIKFASADGASVTYTVDEFILFDANDVAIMATPGPPPALYAEYTTIHVPFTFTVEEFAKKEVPVEVLCYLPENYEYFGFTWFEITEIVVREFCFFGDICLNGYPFSPEDFDGSLYGTGLGVDVPAIMKIVVKRDGVLVPNNDLFNNESTLGIGEPLCVQFPDRLNVQGEVFTFDLFVWTKLCDGTFDYMYFDTFTSIDDGELDLPVGADNVLDFVVGTCSYADADITYGHFEWLVNMDLFDANNPTGFLFTDDPSQNLWKWTRTNTQGYANIANPIAVALYQGGYEEAGLLGFESIYNFLEDQYNTAGTGFSSAAMYGLLSGYLATGDSDYETLAGNFFAQFKAKYPSDGSGNRPRDDYWGYDFLQLLFSAKMADQAGLTGATAYYQAWIATYEADYVAKAAASDYHKIFINVIATQLGVGDHQGAVDWPTIVSDNTTAGYTSLQEGAYVIIGNSYDVGAVKTVLLDQICGADYSEPLAEAIYALGL